MSRTTALTHSTPWGPQRQGGALALATALAALTVLFLAPAAQAGPLVEDEGTSRRAEVSEKSEVSHDPQLHAALRGYTQPEQVEVGHDPQLYAALRDFIMPETRVAHDPQLHAALRGYIQPEQVEVSHDPQLHAALRGYTQPEQATVGHDPQLYAALRDFTMPETRVAHDPQLYAALRDGARPSSVPVASSEGEVDVGSSLGRITLMIVAAGCAAIGSAWIVSQGRRRLMHHA